MKCPELEKYKRRLDSLFAQVGSLQANPELAADWARYLCVLVAGFLEVAIREIPALYVRRRSNEAISSFVWVKLKEVKNPKMQRILDVVGWFSSEWCRSLKDATDGELKDAVDSIIANRHLIAHGGSTAITPVRMREWYSSAVKVVELIEGQFGVHVSDPATSSTCGGDSL